MGRQAREHVVQINIRIVPIDLMGSRSRSSRRYFQKIKVPRPILIVVVSSHPSASEISPGSLRHAFVALGLIEDASIVATLKTASCRYMTDRAARYPRRGVSVGLPITNWSHPIRTTSAQFALRAGCLGPDSHYAHFRHASPACARVARRSG